MRGISTVVALALVTLSCGSNEYLSSPVRFAEPPPNEAVRVAGLGYVTNRAATQESMAGTIWAQQKLIRNASLSIRVDSVPEALDSVRSVAEGYDGRVADSQAQRNDDGSRQANVVLRVPAESFDDAMEDLRNVADLQRESVTTQDVGKEYADLETRLAVLRQTQERLRSLLRDATGSLSEVLEVEREIGRVLEKIELLEGERRYYDARVAVSTINVLLFEREAVASRSAFASVGAAFERAIDVLGKSVAMLVYLVTFLVPWLILSALVWLVVRRVRGARKSARVTPGDS